MIFIPFQSEKRMQKQTIAPITTRKLTIKAASFGNVEATKLESATGPSSEEKNSRIMGSNALTPMRSKGAS